MRDRSRINALLDKIRRVWHKNPDLRFGQLVDALAAKADKDAFYLEAEDWDRICDQVIDRGWTDTPHEALKKLDPQMARVLERYGRRARHVERDDIGDLIVIDSKDVKHRIEGDPCQT